MTELHPATNLHGALLRPRLALYAYALSAGMPGGETLAAALGLPAPPQTAAQVWAQYAQAEPYPPLEELAAEYGLGDFLQFAVNLALAAELDESIPAAAAALGGGITPVFAARLFSATANEAATVRAQWLVSENILQLLFAQPDTLKLSSPVLRFLLGAEERHTLPRHLDGLALRIGAVFTWDSLILPQEKKALLRHICNRVRFDRAVFGDWGYGSITPYGRGVRALFSGPPGTGKTMAAQVVAGELGMELYRVDISATVSKYIGETEKNLDAVFREAEKSGGILFFDEADAIFGKRGEQKDSHDKYANMQTSFLLQRVEEYRGIVLLATNFASNLDAAFLRRIQVRVDFPAPDAPARLAIWRGLLRPPAQIAEDVDLDFLANKFPLTGSEIKNIVLAAAFLAAAQGGAVSMQEVKTALEMEYGKTDKILSAREFCEFFGEEAR